MEEMFMLSTYDNPYNPFDNFDDWLRFDKDNDHNSCELLARFCYTSEQLTDAENNAEMERAIDELIKYDPLHILIKVTNTKHKKVI